MPFIITKDYFPDEDAKPGTNCNAVGVIGPRNYKGDGSEFIHRFRLLTDDMEVLYEGRSSNCEDADEAFQPLDCFGTPNAGATIIQYWKSGKGGGWKTL